MKKRFLAICCFVIFCCFSMNVSLASSNNSEKANQGTLTLIESSGDFRIDVIDDINEQANKPSFRFLPNPYKVSAKFISSNQFNFYFHNWGIDPIDKVVIYARVFYNNGNSYQALTKTEEKILGQCYRMNKYFYSDVAKVQFVVDVFDDGQKATSVLELRK